LLMICFAPSLSDSFIFLTLTRLVVVLKLINFRFALFSPPPLGDFHQTAGEVGDKEHELPGGEVAVSRGADTGPSDERRHTPSEQVAHQVECHLGLETLGRI
jgi:hypothetical protein